MERVTCRDEHGRLLMNDGPMTRGDACTLLLERCAAYEDIGVEPQEIAQVMRIAEMLNVVDLVKESLRLWNINRHLEADLAISQRRERAAVEDLKLSAKEMQEGVGVCVVCKHYPADISHGLPEICDECAGTDQCFFEWRGPVTSEVKLVGIPIKNKEV